MIFLPRQARDKHRETSKNPDRFLAEFLYEMGSLQVRFEQLDALCFFSTILVYLENNRSRFAKTGSGQTKGL